MVDISPNYRPLHVVAPPQWSDIDCDSFAGLTPAQRETFDLLPPALRKAAQDSWRYAIRLATGERIIFSWLTLDRDAPEWLHLGDVESITPQPADFHFGRGVDVHFRAIAWAADCDS